MCTRIGHTHLYSCNDEWARSFVVLHVGGWCSFGPCPAASSGVGVVCMGPWLTDASCAASCVPHLLLRLEREMDWQNSPGRLLFSFPSLPSPLPTTVVDVAASSRFLMLQR